MTNEDYNSIILNFYSNAFLKISMQGLEAVEANKKAMEMTNNFVEQFHSSIAVDYTLTLEKQNPSLKDKLNHYPQQFWATRYGNNYFNNLLNKISEDVINIVLNAKNNNEKVDANMLLYVVNDITLIYERNLKDGKKQLMKIKKEVNSNKKIHHLGIDFMLILKEAFNKHQKKHPLLRAIMQDFELAA